MSHRKKPTRVVKQGEKINAQPRACLGCTGCCYSHAIPEINKPAESPCPHAIPGVGCQIYDTRPQACRDFVCVWARAPKGSILDKYDRPDRSGVVLDVTAPNSEFGEQVLVAAPSEAGSYRKLTATLLIERIAKTQLVIIREGDKRRVDGPIEAAQRVREFLRSHLTVQGKL